MFNLRLQLKKQGNDPAQELVKLMLNSCYGKTALRHSESTKKLVFDSKINEYIQRHYREIKKSVQIGKIHMVDICNNKLAHFNRVHCGSTILSMSKRIMNEVISLADDKIYYQDTDSLHIKAIDIKPLAEAFYDKFK